MFLSIGALLVLSAGIGLALSILIAVIFRKYATPEHAVADSFSEFHTRLSQLQGQFSSDCANPVVPSGGSADAARREVGEHLHSINKELRRNGLPWVRGTGYISLWERLHRAEEALIEFQPSGAVVAGAILTRSGFAVQKFHAAKT